MITSADTDRHKPMPEPYIYAADKLSVKAKECVVVEDSIQGIKAGKAAGCYVIAIEGSLDKKYLEDANYIISSFDELKKIFNKELT